MLETKRLLIRDTQSCDWAIYRDIAIERHTSNLWYTDYQWPVDTAGVKDVLKFIIEKDCWWHSVVLKSVSSMIGYIYLGKDELEENVGDLGYVFLKEYHHKGYALESCRAIIRHAFMNMDLKAVKVGTAAANISSCRLCERLGMRLIFNGSAAFVDNSDGTPMSFVSSVYFITKAQWLEQNKK